MTHSDTCSPQSSTWQSCPIQLCEEVPHCPNTLQCCLLVMPWPLPLRAIEAMDLMPTESELSPIAPEQAHRSGQTQPTPAGLICTPIAQSPEAYLQYLWQQHRQGATLPPAVVQAWQHFGWIESEIQHTTKPGPNELGSAPTDRMLPATRENPAKPHSPLTEHKQADIDLIDEWWYLLLDAIVSEGYSGLCWLDEDELEES